MTADEQRIVRELSRVTFPPAAGAKALVRSLNAVPDMAAYQLTEKQRAAVLSIACRFRRQITQPVYELAKRLQGCS